MKFFIFSYFLYVLACLASVSLANEKVVGGKPTTIKDHPWQISLRSSGGSHICGGSFIKPNWIITAAHCVNVGSSYSILYGSTYRTSTDPNLIISVSKVVKHVNYTSSNFRNDIALLKLSKDATLDGKDSDTIEMFDGSFSLVGEDSEASGWGTLSSGASSLPTQLYDVKLPIIAQTDPGSNYPTTTPYYEPSQVIAGKKTEGKDTCQGDSGGPLIIKSSGNTYLVGLTSWGYGCGGGGVYTRVSAYTQWVADQIAANP
jgi:secreted trypsin-like serine protease